MGLFSLGLVTTCRPVSKIKREIAAVIFVNLHMDAHEQEVRDCCSLVLDIAEREIFEVRETAADGVDEEIREEILRQLDRIVKLIALTSKDVMPLYVL